MSASAAKVIDLLGGTKVLGKTTQARDVQRVIREGLPYASLEALSTALDVTQRDLTSLLGVAPRTLARRRHQQRLSPIESDRLYRVAHVTHHAARVLGSLGQARAWLDRPNRGLGGETPFSVLDTEVGERQVEEILMRLEHGVYG